MGGNGPPHVLGDQGQENSPGKQRLVRVVVLRKSWIEGKGSKILEKGKEAARMTSILLARPTI